VGGRESTLKLSSGTGKWDVPKLNGVDWQTVGWLRPYKKNGPASSIKTEKAEVWKKKITAGGGPPQVCQQLSTWE